LRQAITTYFDTPGPRNTAAVVEAVEERIDDLRIDHVVVASCTGDTALTVSRHLAHRPGVNIIAVMPPVGEEPIPDKVMERYLPYMTSEHLNAKMEHRDGYWVHKPVTAETTQKLVHAGVRTLRCQYPCALVSRTAAN